MRFDGVEFRACLCGATPLVTEEKTVAGATVITVACPACGLSKSTAFVENSGSGYAHALSVLAGRWNGR